MAILEIRKFPDKLLRQKAQAVDIIRDADIKLIRDMLDTMYFAKGVGLAAPQAGVLKRIIVCNPTGQKQDELALINPRVIYRKGKKVKDCEGCLSIPGITAEVLRFSIVGVTGKGLDGKPLSFEARDLLARIIDHETDHLDGVLFIDRIGFLKRTRFLNKYRKERRIKRD